MNARFGIFGRVRWGYDAMCWIRRSLVCGGCGKSAVKEVLVGYLRGGSGVILARLRRPVVLG